MTLEEVIHDRDLFAKLDIFRNVPPESIEIYLERCSMRELGRSEVLLNPEETNDSIFVVVRGALSVHLDSKDNPPLTVLGPGDCAGEMSIVEETNPSAWVVADEDSELLVIDNETLWDMINVSHGVARNLLAVLSSRVRSDNRIIADSVVIMRQYEESATTDALTNLHNRHWMQEMFRREVDRCQQGDMPVCLIMLDVDHFKPFNDIRGHLAGDHALCKVADALRTQLRPTDLIARFGGDEFAVLLPNTELDTAVEAAERIRSVFSGVPSDSDATDIMLPVTLSLGVTEMEDSDTLDSLLTKADAALYRAKERGRNRVSK